MEPITNHNKFKQKKNKEFFFQKFTQSKKTNILLVLLLKMNKVLFLFIFFLNIFNFYF